MDGFVHLHVHSHFSLLDGATKSADLIAGAKAGGMDAIAITDHGNLFGAVDFATAAKKAGVKPILGLEAYISPTTRHDRSMGNQQTASYHLILLAMNTAGWKNLSRLSSKSYLEGFYYKPRIDRELLSQYNEGLICTTACLGGEIPAALMRGSYKDALRIAGEYKEIFGPERFFIEVQNIGIDEQTRINPELVKIASDLGVGLVGTNDVHFISEDAKPSHEVLTCISTGKTLADSKLDYPKALYLKSAAEMRDALKAFPGAADNTLKIAEMCNFDFDFGTEYLPVFPVPESMTEDSFLADIAWKGLQKRFDDKGISEIPDEYRTRLEWELKVIKDKGYSSYFLIVNDFVEYARENSIPSAPRGSGVATLLGYSLKIAEVDPIQYGLLFERFTDPQREEAPDLDIDMCQEGRPKVIQYVREKYGHVAQIITYGTLKTKAVLKDVGRVLGVELADVAAITKLVPDDLKITIDKALDQEPKLSEWCERDPLVAKMFEHGRRLEGLCRHAGVHAAGVIVADIPLEEVVPLYKQGDSNDVITQWDGPTCEKAGLMKMDFLGLRTLTIIQRARELVEQRIGRDVDPEKIPLDEDEVFKLFRDGHTDGVFQFESDGMKNILKQMKPGRIEDLIAANAMYRPGPMELIPTYCARKDGREEVPSVHALVDDLLAETYGIMAYQEQVMQVLNRLGKLPLNRALTLIKAISKKKHKMIAKELPNFLEGAKENGIDEDQANALFALIEKFAGYGFNKAHSTRYAIVAYQTAYFKHHYPREFLAATLTFEAGDSDKVVQYRGEAARLGIAIAPPNVNVCSEDFAVDGESVRFGLAAVKGVGHSAIEAIVAARREEGAFTDLYDFCNRVDLRAVNKGCIEALIKCGAFDAKGAHRAAMIAVVEQAITIGKQAADDRKSGQMSLGFGMLDEAAEAPAPQFPNIPPWSRSELLEAEKDTLGFYVTDHPLMDYAWEMAHLNWPSQTNFGSLVRQGDDGPESQAVRIGCMVMAVRRIMTKKGDAMAMLTFEDVTGKYEAVCFPRTFETVRDVLENNPLVFVTGTVDRSRDRPQIIVEEIVPIADALKLYTKQVSLFPGAEFTNGRGAELAALLKQHAGSTPVQMAIRIMGKVNLLAWVRVGQAYRVQLSQELLDSLSELLGDQKTVQLVGREVKIAPRKQKTWQKKTPGGQQGQASAAVTRFN